MSIYKEGNRDAIYDFYYKRNRIQQIRGFITVVQHKTFAKASDVLRVSRSTVFSQVKSLEGKLGIALFKKDGRNVVLTEEGRIFYEKSLPILNSIDNLYEDFVDNDIVKYEKVLHIAGHYIFLTKILPKPLSQTLKLNTSLKFEIDSSYKYDALDKLKNGYIDIAFFPCDTRDTKEYIELHFERLAEYRICVYFGKDTNVTQDIVDNLYENFHKFNLLLPQTQPFATKGTGFYTVTKRANENLQSIRKNIIYVEGFDMAKELAKQNLGICVFDDRLFSAEDKKDLNILYPPRNETFDLHYYAITKKDVQMKEGIKSLLKNITNYLQ